jgi:hypothetical protein
MFLTDLYRNEKNMEWTHSICDPCWDLRDPYHEPFRMINNLRISESCCFCGQKHISGIYVREHPDKTKCGGNHKENYDA